MGNVRGRWDGSEPWPLVVAGALAWWPIWAQLAHSRRFSPVLACVAVVWMAARALKRADAQAVPMFLVPILLVVGGCLRGQVDPVYATWPPSLSIVTFVTYFATRAFMGRRSAPEGTTWLAVSRGDVLAFAGCAAFGLLSLADRSVNVYLPLFLGPLLALVIVPRKPIQVGSPTVLWLEALFLLVLGGVVAFPLCVAVFTTPRIELQPAHSLLAWLPYTLASGITSAVAAFILERRRREILRAPIAQVIAGAEGFELAATLDGKVKSATVEASLPNVEVGDELLLLDVCDDPGDEGPYRDRGRVLAKAALKQGDHELGRGLYDRVVLWSVWSAVGLACSALVVAAALR